ncbi:MAG: Maf family protein [Ilumatobacteraceae bacterium]
MTRILLASSSPRRRDLLARLGLVFDTAAPDIDESVRPGEPAHQYVRRLAAEKAAAVDAAATTLIIAADTTVELDGRILGKPTDAAEATAMLRDLSARTHRVHTGVAVRLGERTVVDAGTTMVTMTPLGESTIRWYVATGEPFDKAGAYALQGAASVFVQQIRGSVSNVVGLPLHIVARLAAELGVTVIGERTERDDERDDATG